MLATITDRRQLQFDVHGAGVIVSGDDELALAAIEEFIEPFLAPEVPEHPVLVEVTRSDLPFESDAEEEPVCDLDYFTVSKAGPQRYIKAKGIGQGVGDLDSGTASIRVEGWGRDHPWAVTRLLFLPLWAMLLKTKGRFTLHAAGVASEGRALLFPTSSGGGKSCLTMNLLRAGYGLLGDDTQFLLPGDQGIEVAGFTEKISLRKGACRFFPEFSDLPLGSGGRITVDPWEMGYPIAEGRHTPGIIAFPRVTGERESVIEPVEKTQALQRLVLCSFFFTDQAMLGDHLQALSDFVADAICYRLDVGTDPRSLVETVKRMEAGV